MLVVGVEEVGCSASCDARMLAKEGYWTIALMSGVVCWDWLKPGGERGLSRTETHGEAVWVVASCRGACW